MVRWQIDGIFNADVEKVNTEIQELDKITPEGLLDYAKSHPESESHKCFEWDDTRAAEQYRLSQARKVIQFIVVVPEKPNTPSVRQYQITTQPHVYAPTQTFLVNKDEYTSLLARAKAELQAFKKKYKTLSELESVFEAIDEVM